MTPRTKFLIFGAISIFGGFLFSIIALESIFRCLPVNEGLRTQSVTQNDPIMRFAPNRTSIWSRGWDFSLVNRIRTNNYGFVSDIDYDPLSKTPLLAVIGDSYVEAAMMPYPKTGAAILGRSLEQKARVYSFASSGSPLSQYLAYAAYARETFHPAGLVVVIVENDFDESLLKYKNAPGFHYFTDDDQGKLILVRIDFEPTIWRKVVQRSALGMYLATNLQLENLKTYLNGLIQSFKSQHIAHAQSTVIAENTRITDSKRAIDAFLSKLPSMSGLNPSQIVFAVDGNRRAIYGPEILQSSQEGYFEVMRHYFMTCALGGGFEVIDMQQEFSNHYKRHGQRFEFPNDSHWNPVGHEVFANAVQRSPVYRSVSCANSSITLLPLRSEDSNQTGCLPTKASSRS